MLQIKPKCVIPDQVHCAVIRYHSRRVTSLEFHPTKNNILLSGDKVTHYNQWITLVGNNFKIAFFSHWFFFPCFNLIVLERTNRSLGFWKSIRESSLWDHTFLFSEYNEVSCLMKPRPSRSWHHLVYLHVLAWSSNVRLYMRNFVGLILEMIAWSIPHPQMEPLVVLTWRLEYHPLRWTWIRTDGR